MAKSLSLDRLESRKRTSVIKQIVLKPNKSNVMKHIFILRALNINSIHNEDKSNLSYHKTREGAENKMKEIKQMEEIYYNSADKLPDTHHPFWLSENMEVIKVELLD